MKYIYKITLVFCVFLVQCTWAQQDPQRTFYKFNMNLINPAFAGTADSSELSLSMRSQWASVEGAPQSQSVFFSAPVGNKVGLGVSILNDKTFIENQTWLAIDFSYHLTLKENLDLFFGLKTGANSYGANTAGLVTYGIGQDASLANFESRFNYNIGIGFYLRHNNYFLSLSAPRLLTPNRLKLQNGNAFVSVDKRHLYLAGGYDFQLKENMQLETSSIVRYVNATPLSVEVTSIFNFNYRFKFGASYRYNAAVSGLMLFEISSGCTLGYAYETATQNAINALDNSSHELFMRLVL